MRWFVCTILCCAAPAFAAEVLHVAKNQQILAVSHPAEGPWNVGDRLCVFDTKEEVECGKVTKTTAKVAVVRMDSPNDQVVRGSSVKAVRRVKHAGRGTGERSLAAASSASQANANAAAHPGWNLSGGVTAGLATFFPMLHIQTALGAKAALGLMPVFSQASEGTTSVRAFGGVLTFNYYGSGNFSGFWGQLGLGAYQYKQTIGLIETSAMSLSLLGTLGGRVSLGSSFNFGVGVGVRYQNDPSFLSLIRSAVQPVIVVDLGLKF